MAKEFWKLQITLFVQHMSLEMYINFVDHKTTLSMNDLGN